MWSSDERFGTWEPTWCRYALRGVLLDLSQGFTTCWQSFTWLQYTCAGLLSGHAGPMSLWRIKAQWGVKFRVMACPKADPKVNLQAWVKPRWRLQPWIAVTPSMQRANHPRQQARSQPRTKLGDLNPDKHRIVAIVSHCGFPKPSLPKKHQKTTDSTDFLSRGKGWIWVQQYWYYVISLPNGKAFRSSLSILILPFMRCSTWTFDIKCDARMRAMHWRFSPTSNMMPFGIGCLGFFGHHHLKMVVATHLLL